MPPVAHFPSTLNSYLYLYRSPCEAECRGRLLPRPGESNGHSIVGGGSGTPAGLNPLVQQKNAFNNSRPGGLYRLPAIACPSARGQSQHLRYFTPIDENNTRMFTFALKRVRHRLMAKLWWEILLPHLVRLLQRASDDQRTGRHACTGRGRAGPPLVTKARRDRRGHHLLAKTYALEIPGCPTNLGTEQDRSGGRDDRDRRRAGGRGDSPQLTNNCLRRSLKGHLARGGLPVFSPLAVKRAAFP